MEWVISIFFFLYGITFGSFFNVVGLRVPLKESIVSPPSRCTTCDRNLSAADLVPVFSYVFLRGKCRGCQEKISALYPVMELITGVLFVCAYLYFGFQWELAVALLFISMLVILTVSDLKYMLIPNKILLPFGVAIFMLRFISPLTPWWDSLLGAAVGFGVLFLIAVVSNGGMGGGDIKLFFVLGLVLGTMQTLVTLFLASLIGAIVGIIFLKRTKQGRKTPVPFGPSIAAAALIAYFFGAQLVTWYTGLLN
ncbi:prepilin peptidase [Sporosarcina sp. P37]|uniref:prepilin peptidase n=1 Tax=unclassified Sporosarcina TaxID=2647733 RepID=UPI0009C07FAD|nr:MULTISPECIES: A24 family peptidase [unclassified Sporosarcina]ARD47039.1 prepilin peptidase [Sporosarcina sp. P33]ARK23609.1 prepilin peptidase [Sporosarcina sp. P37]PID18768.1 prepilin peptidase [Sporosarcina sp. P35]